MEEHVRIDYDIKKFYKEREAEDSKNNITSPLKTTLVSKQKMFDPHLNNVLWTSDIIPISSELSLQATISSYDNNEPKFYIHKHINIISSHVGGYKKIIVSHISLKEFFMILTLMKDVRNLFENFFYSYLKEEREKIEKYLEDEFLISNKTNKIDDIEKSNKILEKIK